MKVRYFAYRSTGFVGDYFGHIGNEVEISFLRFCWMKMRGYRVMFQRYSGGVPVIENNKCCRIKMLGCDRWGQLA